MGKLLSTAEIAYLRREAQSSLAAGPAVLLRGTVVDDGGGGGSETFNPVGTFDARIAPLNAQEVAMEGGRIASEVEAVLTLPAVTPVEVEDRIKLDGHTYDVVGIRPYGAMETLRRVEVKEFA